MTHDAKSLRQELAEAFAKREYPGDDRIAHGFDMADYGGNLARDWLRGKAWRDVLQEGVTAKHAELPQFLMFDAWLYYFPAFAILALDPNESRLARTMLLHLSWNAKEFAYRATSQEKLAIVHWLETMSNLHEEGSKPAIQARETLARHRDTFMESAAPDDHRPQRDRDVERLRAELAAAFAEREYPGDDRLVHTRSGHIVSDEAFEAHEWLRGKTWQELLEEGMGIEHRDYVSSLSPEGWLYYFPALATFGLDADHPAEMDENLPLRLAWHPHEIKPLVGARERRAIAHLLTYWAEARDRRPPAGDNAPRYALETHWSEAAGEAPPPAAPPRERKALQAEIQEAFATREPPEADEISDIAQFGDTAKEAQEWLRGKTWQELLAEGIPVENGYLFVSLFPKAWLYYFPAAAFLALEPADPGRLENDLLVKLTWFPHELEPHLEPAERRAIVHFLEHWANAYDQGRYEMDTPRYALTTHWSKALTANAGGEGATDPQEENGHALS